MASPGGAWRSQAAPGAPGQPLALPPGPWWTQAVLGGSWRPVAASGGPWRSQAAPIALSRTPAAAGTPWRPRAARGGPCRPQFPSLAYSWGCVIPGMHGPATRRHRKVGLKKAPCAAKQGRSCKVYVGQQVAFIGPPEAKRSLGVSCLSPLLSKVLLGLHVCGLGPVQSIERVQ